jgi:hypothetical protein
LELSSTEIRYAVDDRVYSSRGDVIDVSNPASPVKAGAIARRGAICPLIGLSQVVILSHLDEPATLRSYDPSTLTLQASVVYEALDPADAWDLVSTDGSQLAFLARYTYYQADPGDLYVVANPFL